MLLAHELGKQSILANFPSYLRLSMVHYIGQWSIMSLKLPPTAEAINGYVASYPKVPLDGVLGDVILRPTASARAYFVYPAFLGAGIVTLVAGLALVAFIVCPGLGDETRAAQYLMLAAFFAATCHSYTLLISFINLSTPRYLMAVYPQLILAAVFLISAFLVQARKNSQERAAFRTAPPRPHSSRPTRLEPWAPRVCQRARKIVKLLPDRRQGARAVQRMLNRPVEEPRFGFGDNWLDFARDLRADQIAEAEKSIGNLLQRDTLAGLRFVDVGSGSGLFSLAARRLGARVHSFDFDAGSVLCTAGLRDRYFPGDADWTVEQGSILDPDYVRRLGIFDVAYSWGVLHHTGAMRDALRAAAAMVAPGGCSRSRSIIERGCAVSGGGKSAGTPVLRRRRSAGRAEFTPRCCACVCV